MLTIYNYSQACVFVPYKIFKDPITKWQWIVANFWSPWLHPWSSHTFLDSYSLLGWVLIEKAIMLVNKLKFFMQTL
jgi:hypothetical protein